MNPSWRILRSPALLTAVVLLTGAGFGLRAVVAARQWYLTKLPIHAEGGRAVQATPAETEHWVRVGTDRQESDAMIEELGTTNYLNRLYVSLKPIPGVGDGQSPVVVDLHMAYYTGLIDTVPHVPERCMTGGGWEITGSSTIVPIPLDRSGWIPDTSVPENLRGRVMTARLPSDPRYTDAPGTRVRLPLDPESLSIRVTRFQNPRTGESMYAGYFFIANGGTVASAEGVRLLAFDLRDDYAYYLKVQFSSAQARSAQDLAAMAGALLDDLLPEIMRCVPDWVKVQTGEYPPDNPRRRRAEAAAAK